MFKPTLITWILIIFGLITCGPLLFAQAVMIFQPDGRTAKDLIIGKGEEWRDKTHFKSAFGLAITDWMVFAPVFVLSIVGIVLKTHWGYVFFCVAGSIQVYMSVFLWFFEKEYVYPANGPLRYFTYIWGNFIYWGTAAFVYGIVRLSGIIV